MYGLCVLVILWTLNGLVGGYGKGSPGSSCKNLEPQHYGATPQTSESPYRIDVIDPTSDGKTTVRISGADVMGFVVHARDVHDTVVGSFSDLPPLTATITCRTEADTWSHADTSLKTDPQARWAPPPHFTGTVHFRGSVLRDEKTYWVNLTTKHVVGSASGNTETGTTTDTATGDNSQHNADGDVAATTAGDTSRSNEL